MKAFLFYMVKNLKPANNDSFQELLKFGEIVLDICQKLKIIPVVYGSLAYFYHTQDANMPINDLDLLVPEDSFPDLIRLLDKQNKIIYQQMPYHSIEVFMDDLKIDLDSIENFLYPRSKKSSIAKIGKYKVKIINAESLADIYQEALNNMPNIKKLDKKRAVYAKKLSNLKKLS